MSMSNDFFELLVERGHAPTFTDQAALAEQMGKGPISGYIGFDPTADSLHIGSLTQLMLLRRLQQCGHKPVVLVGGATGKIGDPSGRDSSRQLMTDEILTANVAGIKADCAKLLRFGDGKDDALLVNNADWMNGVGYIDFLRTVGQHFTINRMLTMDSVKLRLEREQPLTYLEFSYMILQGYDFVELHKRYGICLQMGGSDQWGNIIQGVELGRRMHGYSLFGITQPLMTTASGAKMGKSADGAVWLSADKKSPYDFWQYWRNAEDADVGRWLRLFTDLPIDEIKRLEALQGSEINDAKKVLATEVTAMIHGREAAEAAAVTAQKTFEQGGLGGDLPTITLDPAIEHTVADVAVTAGLAASKGEARKLIQGGGIRINDEKVTDPHAKLTKDQFQNNSLKLSKGQKNVVKVELLAG